MNGLTSRPLEPPARVSRTPTDSNPELEIMLLRIQHETKLSYSEPVSETVFDVRMAPPSDEDQTNLGYRLRIVPSAPVTIYRDGFGNRVDLFNIITPYNELIIRATSIVRTHRGPAPESRLSGVEWEAPPRRASLALDSLEYLQPSPLVEVSPELAGVSSPGSSGPRAS